MSSSMANVRQLEGGVFRGSAEVRLRYDNEHVAHRWPVIDLVRFPIGIRSESGEPTANARETITARANAIPTIISGSSAHQLIRNRVASGGEAVG